VERLARRETLTPDERSLRARIGAYAQHARHDPRETTRKARAAFLAGFLNAQPADLPETERLRRAEAALRAHMARLAYRSARICSTQKAGAQVPDRPEGPTR